MSTLQTCPDWSTLLAHRFAEPSRFGDDQASAEPAGWPAALAHLEACPDCRVTALAIDPSLLFELLPVPAIDDREVEAMRLAVRGMVQAHEVETREAARRVTASPRWRGLAAVRGSAALWRGVAAAALVLATLLVVPRPGEDAVEVAVASAAETGAVSPLAVGASAAMVTSAAWAEPLVESIDRPEATVYQLESDGLAVVMIVDSTLDV